MTDELNNFFDQMPPGWGIVPLHGQPEHPQEAQPIDYNTLASHLPKTHPGREPTKSSTLRCIDGRVEAGKRRYGKDPVQIAWDREADALMMTKVICGDRGLAGVIPVAQIMEQLKRTLAGRVGGFGRVSRLMTDQALYTCARFLHKGDVEMCITAMAPIYSLVANKPGPEACYSFLAQLIRDLFPSAPDSYIPPNLRVGAAVRKPDVKAQRQRKATLGKPPNLEKVRAMDPDKARMMLPIMYEAVQGCEEGDREEWQAALAAVKARAEVV